MKKVLIIEDDPAIIEGLEAALKAEHYDVHAESDGLRGEKSAMNDRVDVILLDLMLPSKNGMDICRSLRSAGVHTPIIMLTSKSEEIDKLIGFELGADDYVTKPFSVRELMARIKAQLKRSAEIVSDLEEFTFGSIHVDFKKMETVNKSEPVKLSAKEYEILKYFVSREGQVITRDMLLNDIWGYEQFPTTRTVDNYILALRKKIEEDPAKPVHLITMHTAGYKFVAAAPRR